VGKKIIGAVVVVVATASFVWFDLPHLFGHEATIIHDGQWYWYDDVTVNGDESKGSWESEKTVEFRGVSFVLRLVKATQPAFLVGTVISFALRALASHDPSNGYLALYDAPIPAGGKGPAEGFADGCNCGITWEGHKTIRIYVHPWDAISA
jgi:hypothetical protein